MQGILRPSTKSILMVFSSPSIQRKIEIEYKIAIYKQIT